MILKIFVNSRWACQPSTALRAVASSAIVLPRLRLVRAAAPTAHAVPLTIDDLFHTFLITNISKPDYINGIRNTLKMKSRTSVIRSNSTHRSRSKYLKIL